MSHTIEISGRLLFKNYGLNVVGIAIPSVVALASIPHLVHGLGPERFGVLSIAWAVLGPLSVFDLGLGRATTRVVAECLGSGENQRLPVLVWTSLWSQLLLGAVGSVTAAALVPTLVDRFLHVSATTSSETRLAFFILAGSLPVVLGGNAFRGVLEAAQRFDIVNYVKVPVTVSTFLFPVAALSLGLHLPGITLVLVLVRLGAAMAYLAACLRLFPTLRHAAALDSTLLRPLLVYGGWVTVSNILNPVLTYVDRFVISSALSMTAVGYYAAPSEAISKAGVLPGGLVATLFPAFASLDASGSRGKLADLYVRSLKSLLLLMGPGILLLIVLAPEILRFWLGQDFAAESTTVLQILSVGAFVNALGFIPFSLLQARGRADLTAKFHLLESPLYAVALLILLRRMGLPGAALAWTLRLSLDAIFLFAAVFWLRLVPLRALRESSLQRTAFVVAVFGATLALPVLASGALVAQLLLDAIVVLGFAIAVWSYALDQKDKSLLLFAVGEVRATFGRIL